MFTFVPTNQFKKDLKKLIKQSKNNNYIITEFLEELQNSGVSGLNSKFKAHKLSGNYNNNWEAHIKPDLLIIWFEISKEKTITLIRIGSHSELF